ncbi:hypothetical protein P4O66_010624 [Electrophorus voltai]|uniref:Small ribosomal subunit protein eS19 n=1 Tax=Electrophorus voltai TaxID=2609070 RepID=A0AAD9DXW1_9TELE|nr:hypothetical protein P4O66_010624 [Electrophorus voltai]
MPGGGVTVKDVNQQEFVRALAAFLKKSGKLKVPDWVDIVKLAKHKELAPCDDNWFYIRAASTVRHLYLRGGVGVGSMIKIYGGRKRNGVCPSHFSVASKNVARKVLQALEALKMVEKDPNGGRRLTPQGTRDLDRIAGQAGLSLTAAAGRAGPSFGAARRNTQNFMNNNAASQPSGKEKWDRGEGSTEGWRHGASLPRACLIMEKDIHVHINLGPLAVRCVILRPVPFQSPTLVKEGSGEQQGEESERRRDPQCSRGRSQRGGGEMQTNGRAIGGEAGRGLFTSNTNPTPVPTPPPSRCWECQDLRSAQSPLQRSAFHSPVLRFQGSGTFKVGDENENWNLRNSLGRRLSVKVKCSWPLSPQPAARDWPSVVSVSRRPVIGHRWCLLAGGP